MKGGYLQTDEEIVGDLGKGTFTQKGGTHLITSHLIVGDSSTANGAFNLLGGSLSAANEFIGAIRHRPVHPERRHQYRG